jgi:hypothetical protein
MRIFSNKPLNVNPKLQGERARSVRVSASCRSGRSSSTFVLSDAGAVLIHHVEPRGLARGRAFAWAGRGRV